jgi:hypothetical protein
MIKSKLIKIAFDSSRNNSVRLGIFQPPHPDISSTTTLSHPMAPLFQAGSATEKNVGTPAPARLFLVRATLPNIRILTVAFGEVPPKAGQMVSKFRLTAQQIARCFPRMGEAGAPS